MVIHSALETKKRFEQLPPEIKELIYGSDMTFTIQQIGQKNALHIDQIDALNTEAGEVMMGFVESKDFVTELMETLNLDQAKATAVAKDVDEMLFSKIRDSMKKFYEANHKPAPVLSPTVAASPSSETVKPLLSQIMPINKGSAAPILAPSAAPQTPPAPAVVTKPPVTTPPALNPLDMMMTEKTVDLPKPPVAGAPAAPVTTPKPPATPPVYKKNDPYREPVE
jgi:hypothetical protein